MQKDDTIIKVVLLIFFVLGCLFIYAAQQNHKIEQCWTNLAGCERPQKIKGIDGLFCPVECKQE